MAEQVPILRGRRHFAEITIPLGADPRARHPADRADSPLVGPSQRVEGGAPTAECVIDPCNFSDRPLYGARRGGRRPWSSVVPSPRNLNRRAPRLPAARVACQGAARASANVEDAERRYGEQRLVLGLVTFRGGRYATTDSKQTRLGSSLATTSLRVFALAGLLVAMHADCMALALRVPLAKDGLAPDREVRVDFYGDVLPSGAVARMGTPRFWIGPMITTIAFSPDGKTLTAASDSSTPSVPIWDAKNGQVIRALAPPSFLQPEEGEVRDVAVAPVGSLMATLNGDDTARVWERATGRLIREFHLLGDAPICIFLGSDGATLFSIGGGVTIWNVRTGETVRRLAAPAAVASLKQVALSPDGRFLAAAYFDQRIRLWDVASGKLVREIGDPGLICPNAFSRDGKSFTSVGRDGTINTRGASNGNLLSSSVLVGAGKIAARDACRQTAR